MITQFIPESRGGYINTSSLVEWCTSNPNGYFLELFDSKNGQLHSASCRAHYDEEDKKWSALSHTGCSTNMDELIQWGRSHKRKITACNQCISQRHSDAKPAPPLLNALDWPFPVPMLKKKSVSNNPIIVTSNSNRASYQTKLAPIRDWLIEVARSNGQVTYGDIMNAFGIDLFSLQHALSSLGHQSSDLNEPIITALVINQKTRQCSEGLSKEFGILDDENERHRLHDYWKNHQPEAEHVKETSSDLDSKAARFVSVEARPDQAAFRREVFLACKGKCIISGCDVVKALDAAHKTGRNWRLGHNKAEDGYLLRKDLHALYDNDLLWIDDDGMVRVDPSVIKHYKQFEGVRITLEGDHPH